MQPMLARLERELPLGHLYRYEPKWDGFRCIASLRGTTVELTSRNDRPLTRYFPEVVGAFSCLKGGNVTLDGELVVVSRGRFDFPALMSRLHPAASRVTLLAAEVPALFIAFDLMEQHGASLTDSPFDERRQQLEQLLMNAPPPLRLSPSTSDVSLAEEWLDNFVGGGIDGVVAKAGDSRYEPGKRTMVKVKRLRSVECVVAGFRVYGDRRAVSSLLLGVFDEQDVLRHVGVASTFKEDVRRELVDLLTPYVTTLEGHPWETGFATEGGPMGRLKGAAGKWTPDMERDWVPLTPELVCEVGYDQLDGYRFRHPARFLRWRPDRDACSCHTDQLTVDGKDVEAVVGT